MPAGSPGTAGALAPPLGRGPALPGGGHLPPLRNCEPRTAWPRRLRFHAAFAVVLTDVCTRSGSGRAAEDARTGWVRCPQTGREWVFVKAECCGHHSSLYSVSFCICLNFFTKDTGRKGGERKEKKARQKNLFIPVLQPKEVWASPCSTPHCGRQGPPHRPPMQRKGESVAQGQSHRVQPSSSSCCRAGWGAFLLPRARGYL